jgi:hypothetical protein
VTANDRSSEETTTTGAGDAGARLIVPEGLALDEAAYQRMLRSLRRAPAAVAGIAASTGMLPPGSSYRVHAEWTALEHAPEDPGTYEPGAKPACTAVLLRPGVGADLLGDGATMDATILRDRGAYVHDPRREPGRLEVASERGQPPFPRRPLVVLVACEVDPDLAIWARGLVNELLGHDIEARLALPEVVAGPHLTRPCQSCEASIRALRPDVVVALDAAAAEQAPRWCRDDRSTVIVEFVAHFDERVAIVPWRIGRASGRLRARIGRTVDAATLAGLVQRLCAGPHPMPPSDRPGGVPNDEAATRRAGRAHTPDRPQRSSEIVLIGTTDAIRSPRVEALATQLAAGGVPCTIAPAGHGCRTTTREAGLVLLVGTPTSDAVDGLLTARHAAGKATVAQLLPDDVADDAHDAAPRLTAGAAELAVRCGRVVSPPGAVHAAATALGVRTHVLAALLSPTRADALRQAWTERVLRQSGAVTIGWQLAPARRLQPPYLTAVADALARVLDERPDARLQLVGDDGTVPAKLRSRNQVSTLPKASPEMLAGWSIHVWTPALLRDSFDDDLGPFVETSHAGVPSVLPAPGRAVIDGSVDPELVVSNWEAADSWVAAVRRLLDDEGARSARAREAANWSHAVHGPSASTAAVHRFLGWASYGAAG